MDRRFHSHASTLTMQKEWIPNVSRHFRRGALGAVLNRSLASRQVRIEYGAENTLLDCMGASRRRFGP